MKAMEWYTSSWNLLGIHEYWEEKMSKWMDQLTDEWMTDLAPNPTFRILMHALEW